MVERSRSMRVRGALLAIAILASTLLVAYHQNPDPLLRYPHWDGSGVRTIAVVTTLDPSYTRWTNRVLRWWEASGVVDFILQQGVDDGRCELPSSDIKICRQPNTNDPGSSQVAWQASHFYAAAVRVNLQWKRGFLTVLCHELGHALGLKHQNELSRSCLSNPTDLWYDRKPDAHDFETLSQIYGHRD